MPAPSSGAMADNSLLAATAEYEETKIRLLENINASISGVLSKIDFITKIMGDELALTQARVNADKLKAGDELEKNREKSIGERAGDIGKEVEKKSRSFLTVLTAFLIPAIIGFVSTLVDMSSPLGLLKGAIVSLAIWFGGRALLGLIVKGLATAIAAAFLFISKAFMTKIIAPLGAILAKTKLGSMFNRAPSGVPSTGAPAGVPGKAGDLGKASGGMNKFASGLQAIATGAAAFANWKVILGLTALTLAAMGLGKALEYAAPAIKEFAPVLIKIADVIGNVVVTAIKEFFGVVKELVAVIPDAFRSIGEAIDSVLGGVANVIKTIGDTIANVLTSISNSFIKTLLTLNELDGAKLIYAAAGITAVAFALMFLTGAKILDGLFSLFSSDPIGKLVKLGNVAPNIVELAGVMADFGNIVEFFNDAMDNLDGDKALKNFKLMRDGILMIGEALDDVSMIKLVAFSALSKPSIDNPVVPEVLSPTATTISNAADRATGNVVSESEEPLRTRRFEKPVRIRDRHGDISGTLQGGLVVGNITYGGTTITPADPQYHQLADRLNEAAFNRLETSRERFEARREARFSGRPIAAPTTSTRASAVDDLTRGVNSARTGSTAQPNMMSVNNVNSVNKSETNYKSTSMGSALQGDALRYVY
jgi:hypothetical protein